MPMVKSFKYLRIQFGGTNPQSNTGQSGRPVYKHSMYLQSKDSSWINRNISTTEFDDEIEPLEEDIRD